MVKQFSTYAYAGVQSYAFVVVAENHNLAHDALHELARRILPIADLSIPCTAIFESADDSIGMVILGMNPSYTPGDSQTVQFVINKDFNGTDSALHERRN